MLGSRHYFIEPGDTRVQKERRRGYWLAIQEREVALQRAILRPAETFLSGVMRLTYRFGTPERLTRTFTHCRNSAAFETRTT